MIRVHGHGAAIAVLLATLTLVGGCGVSASDAPPTFEFTVVGPDGGTIQAGDVTLFVSPGAFDADTAVTIIPQEDPLPVAQIPGDPCIYSYLGPLWCIGPLGHQLNVASEVKVDYPADLVPPGMDQGDLVLLQWDDSQNALVANLGAFHDLPNSAFTDFDYLELGHIAIGIRECPTGGIAFTAFTPEEEPEQDEEIEFNEFASTFPVDEGMFVVNVDKPGLGITLVETENNGLPTKFVFSPDERRIMYDDFDPFEESPILKTVFAGPFEPPVTVAQAPRNVQPFDPFAGWLRDDGGRHVFFRERLEEAGPQEVQPTSAPDGGAAQHLISRVIGDGSVASLTAYGVSAFDVEPVDIRQSPDGRYALVLFDEFADLLQGSGELFVSGNRIDIFDIANSAPVSSGQIPVGGGLFTKRFTPDSTGVYGVAADRLHAEMHSVEGFGPTVLWMPELSSSQRILDFIALPDEIHFVAIVTDNSAYDESGLDKDFLYLGTVGNPGAVLEIKELGDLNTYVEAVVADAPDGVKLYLDRGTSPDDEVVPFSLDPAVPSILQHFPLIAPGLEKVDINWQDGRLLQVFEPSAGSAAATISPGSNSEPPLQKFIDDILDSGSIDVRNDQTGDELFAAIDDTALATIIIERGSQQNSNVFGIYENGDPTNRAIVFDGPSTVGDQALIQLKPNGDVVRVEGLSETVIGTGFEDGTFGFYLSTRNDDTFFSERSLNGGDIYMIAFRGDGTDHVTLGPLDQTFGVNDFILGWEDLPRGHAFSDLDFQDAVIYVTNLIPVSRSTTSNLLVSDSVGNLQLAVPLPLGMRVENARWRKSVRTTPGMNPSPPRVR